MYLFCTNGKELTMKGKEARILPSKGLRRRSDIARWLRVTVRYQPQLSHRPRYAL
jgi:hypothetical protein